MTVFVVAALEEMVVLKKHAAVCHLRLLQDIQAILLFL